MNEIPTLEELLRAVTYRKIDVEQVLDPAKPSWIAFDPEIGYVPADIVLKDGVDGSRTTYSHGKNGERRMVNYPDQPCRINTYGDSFTQCQQVSDDETWQERLAAHIGEPVRNFGCGGHSVYTAFTRMMRMESTDLAAEYILLNCFVDDHVRNLDAARWIRTAWSERNRPADQAYPLHGLPWAHLRYDLNTKQFVHCPGKCRSAEDLMALTDPDHFVETFRDDQIVRLYYASLGGETRFDDLEELGREFGLELNLRNPETRIADAQRLHVVYGCHSTAHILGNLVNWCTDNNRKLLVLTSYCIGTLNTALSNGPRHDQLFVDYLAKQQIPWVDAIECHRKDFEQYKLSSSEYLGKYYIKAKEAAVFGHYNPVANMFYAFAIKDAVVNYLQPRPPAYRDPA